MYDEENDGRMTRLDRARQVAISTFCDASDYLNPATDAEQRWVFDHAQWEEDRKLASDICRYLGDIDSPMLKIYVFEIDETVVVVRYEGEYGDTLIVEEHPSWGTK